MKFKVVIPARSNSKRLPGKNMKILGNKPLIQYSIDYALNFFSKDDIWINSDDPEVLNFTKDQGLKILIRPKDLSSDFTSTVDVLKFQLEFFKKNKIKCDAVILLQPTNPFRKKKLLKDAILKYKKSNRNSLATFSFSKLKLGNIKNNFFSPINYFPGQRGQDIDGLFYENGLLYITDCNSILSGNIITKDVIPLKCYDIKSSVDIDNLEDFIFAESLLKLKE